MYVFMVVETVFSSDEVIVLSTALSVLCESKYVRRLEDGRLRIICADGKKRKFFEHELTKLADKVGLAGGVESLEDKAKEVASEVFRK